MASYIAPTLVDRGAIVIRTRGSDWRTLESASKALNETAGEIEDTSSDVETLSDDPA